MEPNRLAYFLNGNHDDRMRMVLHAFDADQKGSINQEDGVFPRTFFGLMSEVSFFSHENPRVPPKTPGDDVFFYIFYCNGPLIKFNKADY